MNIKQIKQQMLPILKKEKISKAGIFGSYSRGDNKRTSDIDILIQAPSSMTLLDLVRIKILLENKLKKSVDLVEYQTIKPQIKKQILSEEIRILK
jgi:predicted nucleotidyltransferase